MTASMAKALRSGSRICGVGRKRSLRAVGRSAMTQGKHGASGKVTCAR